MKAFSVFSDPSYFEAEKEDDVVKSVNILAKQYGLNSDEAYTEISDIRHYIPALEKGSSSVSSFIDLLITKETSSMFPILSKLACIHKTLPPHTADCERDFSRMKLIKTNIRNKMGEDSLDYLMRISINGPPCDKFPFDEAVKVWAEKKERRYKIKLL